MRYRLAGAFALALGVALGAPAQGQQQKQEREQGKDERGKVVTVQGCLSSGKQNALILTADPGELTSGVTATTGGAVRTITYQLVSRQADELQKLVGKRVEVRGRADEDPSAEAKVERQKETRVPPYGQGVEPKVETTEKANIEVKRLRVVSYKPLAGDCLTGK